MNLRISNEQQENGLSEEAQVIIGKTPHWIVKQGIIVIFIISCLFILAATFFKYPDVITSEITLISNHPAISVVARVSGKIDTLLCENGEFVNKGETIALVENTASNYHVLVLQSALEQIEPDIFSYEYWEQFEVLLNESKLGIIQPAFSLYLFHLKEYFNYNKISKTKIETSSIKKELNLLSHYYSQLKRQLQLQERNVVLNHQRYIRDSLLFETGAISVSVLEESEMNWLQAQLESQSKIAAISNVEMEINRLKYRIRRLEDEQNESVFNYQNQIMDTYQALLTSISEWEMRYLLSSPITGKVEFHEFWTNNQFVSENEIVFHIIPVIYESILGRMKIPPSGSGKVEIGQMVLVKLENYPHTEFGLLEGTVLTKSLLPTVTGKSISYIVEVEFENDLTSNYGIQLPFNQEMIGIGEIITNKLSILQRIVNPVKVRIKKNTQISSSKMR